LFSYTLKNKSVLDAFKSDLDAFEKNKSVLDAFEKNKSVLEAFDKIEKTLLRFPQKLHCLIKNYNFNFLSQISSKSK
jgi:hypothetical protein